MPEITCPQCGRTATVEDFDPDAFGNGTCQSCLCRFVIDEDQDDDDSDEDWSDGDDDEE